MDSAQRLILVYKLEDFCRLLDRRTARFVSVVPLKLGAAFLLWLPFTSLSTRNLRDFDLVVRWLDWVSLSTSSASCAHFLLRLRLPSHLHASSLAFRKISQISQRSFSRGLSSGRELVISWRSIDAHLGPPLIAKNGGAIWHSKSGIVSYGGSWTTAASRFPVSGEKFWRVSGSPVIEGRGRNVYLFLPSKSHWSKCHLEGIDPCKRRTYFWVEGRHHSSRILPCRDHWLYKSTNVFQYGCGG